MWHVRQVGREQAVHTIIGGEIDKRRTVVGKVMSPRIAQNAGNFLIG